MQGSRGLENLAVRAGGGGKNAALVSRVVPWIPKQRLLLLAWRFRPLTTGVREDQLRKKNQPHVIYEHPLIRKDERMVLVDPNAASDQEGEARAP